MRHTPVDSLKRLLSLDVFRGFTIALMVLVNTLVLSPYSTLEHSEWNGCTLADMVFPFFVWVMGISLVLSFTKQQKLGVDTVSIWTKMLRRTLVIFLLGLLLNAFPYHMTSDTLSTLRLYGVLQRLAVCYFFASIACLTLNTYLHTIVTVVLLVGYWVLLTYVPVPHYGAGHLLLGQDLGAYWDHWLVGSNHMYQKRYDPEGLLGTLPAIATALLGNLTGIWLLSKKSPTQKFTGMLVAGSLALLVGWTWGQWFPINKALWTSSYVLWTGGLALYGFAVCYGLIEIKRWHRWSKPFEILGVNAIFVYFFHVFFLKIQLWTHVIIP